jgi:hypothetical protein
MVGGYIAGSADLLDMIRSYTPEFIFTTSLPPPNVAGAQASFAYQKEYMGDRRLQHLSTREFKRHFVGLDIPVVPGPSSACSSAIRCLPNSQRGLVRRAARSGRPCGPQGAQQRAARQGQRLSRKAVGPISVLLSFFPHFRILDSGGNHFCPLVIRP